MECKWEKFESLDHPTIETFAGSEIFFTNVDLKNKKTMSWFVNRDDGEFAAEFYEDESGDFTIGGNSHRNWVECPGFPRSINMSFSKDYYGVWRDNKLIFSLPIKQEKLT